MADAARDTPGAAAAVASQLLSDLGSALLRVAQDAFTKGLRIVAGTSAAFADAAAVVAATLLRKTVGMAQEVGSTHLDGGEGALPSVSQT